jgi:hypothetical protein
MPQTIEIETVVQPDGTIIVRAPELTPGQRAKVVITMEGGPSQGGENPLDILADMPGHLEFQTAEEVDAYLREERESWER